MVALARVTINMFCIKRSDTFYTVFEFQLLFIYNPFYVCKQTLCWGRDFNKLKLSRFLFYMQFSMYNFNEAKAVFSHRENHVERNGFDLRSKDFFCLSFILSSLTEFHVEPFSSCTCYQVPRHPFFSLCEKMQDPQN